MRESGNNHMETVRSQVHGCQDLGFFGLGSE
jgi:hypothetical protein